MDSRPYDTRRPAPGGPLAALPRSVLPAEELGPES